MTNRNLPSFSNHPLIEVALSVQFEPITNLSIPEIGVLWQEYQGRFTKIQQHPELETFVERLGVGIKVNKLPKMEFMDSLPVPRIWFLDDEEKEIIQIQQNRFVKNWRKRSDSDEYPRYVDNLRGAFLEDLNGFISFLSKRELGDFTPNQCELTYVNHIQANKSWSKHSELSHILNSWHDGYCKEPGLEVENIGINILHLLKDKEDNFIGRLHVSVQPGFRNTDDMPIYTIKLVARGKPANSNVSGVMDFFDFGHEKIVNIFTKITTDEMHLIWERNN